MMSVISAGCDALRRAEEVALRSDLFIVLGSSLVVYPAAMIPMLARQNGAKLVIVNREPTEMDDIADVVVHDSIGEVFGELALVNQDKRLASVIASTKSVCLAVDQKFLQDIHPREEDPDFHASLYEFVARLMMRKLEATSKRLAEVEKELRQLREVQATAQPAAATKPKHLESRWGNLFSKSRI